MNVEFKRQPTFDQYFGNKYREVYPLEEDVIRILKICDIELRINTFKVQLSSYITEMKDPGMSVGGIAISADEILLDFTLNTPYPIKSIRIDMMATLAHEYGHCARIKLLNDKRNTLWQAIIWEGVAIHFQRRVFPNLRTFERFVPECKQTQILNALQRDRNRIENAGLLYDWVFGEGDLPWCSLYKAAEVVIGEHLKNRSLTTKELLQINPDDVSIPLI